jgi:hypothetical protein
MTVSTADLREEYTATAGQTVFTFSFRVFGITDVKVYKTPTGVAFNDAAYLTTAYTVTVNADQDANQGGSITLNAGATAGDRITIISNVADTRATDYKVGGKFDPDIVDNDFDRSLSIAKQAKEAISLAPRFQESQHGASDLKLPLDAGNFWRVNSAGNAIESVPLGALSENVSTASDLLYSNSSSGLTATDVQAAINEVSLSARKFDDYASLIAIDTNTLVDGALISITDVGISGDGVLRNVASHGITSTSGIKVRINDDWYWERVFTGYANVKWFGAVGDGLADDTAAIQDAIDSYKFVSLGDGLYLIDPSISLKVRYGTTIKGNGQTRSGLLAKFNVSGSVIHRDFTAGVANDRVQYVFLEGFSVFLNHIHQSSVPSNIQQGFNFRDIGRSTIKNCYSGNYKDPNDSGVGALANSLYPNAGDKTQAMRGYPFVLGNRSASDVAYAGGEVNRILYCRSWWARKGITLDDQDLTGGVSATYNAILVGNDIQTTEVGINQGSQFNAGCTFQDNLIQDLKNAAGSTSDVFVYSIAGYDNKVFGGYVETPDADLTACIHFASTANNNEIGTFYHDVPDAKFIQDDSSVPSQNIVEQINESDELIVTEGGIQFRPARTKAFVVFDGSGTILNSLNVSSVVDIGVGDTNVSWSANIGVASNSCFEVTCQANSLGQATLGYVRTHSATTTRVDTYNVQTSSFEDVPKTSVIIRG